jgi:hypothetical protein
MTVPLRIIGTCLYWSFCTVAIVGRRLTLFLLLGWLLSE